MVNLHIDMTNGGQVNTLLGALLDANVLSAEAFLAEFSALAISDDVEISIRDEYDGDVKAKKVTIIDKTKLLGNGAEQKKTIKDVLRSVVTGGLSQNAELRLVKIFETLSAGASATDEAIDYCLENDVIAAMIGVVIILDKIGCGKISVSNINVGSGIIVRDMSAYQVPTPLTKVLLKPFVTFKDEREGELTGPAMAALLQTVVNAENLSGETVATGQAVSDKVYAGFKNTMKVKLYGGNEMENEFKNGGAENMQKISADENNLEGSFKKIDRIMQAMADLEASLKVSAAKAADRKRAEDLNPAGTVLQPELSQSPKRSVGQDVILDKIKQIELKLKDKAPEKDESRYDAPFAQAEEASDILNVKKNSSLEKFERLEREAGLYGSEKSRAAIQTPAGQAQTETNAVKSEKEQATAAESKSSAAGNHSIIEISSNIDNSTGEELGFLAELIMANGAYDVYFEAIFTNSFKPAYKLSAIINAKDLALFSKLILMHSGTVRVKYTNLNTIDAKSTTIKKHGKFGDVQFERSAEKGDVPHFADKKEIAKKYGLTLREVEKILGKDYE